jgi:hypothetical protein
VWKGGLERITAPKGGLNFFARAFDAGVVQPDNDVFWAVLADSGLDDWCKEGVRIS